MKENYYLAIDIGASGGRHLLGHLEDGRMVLEEVYRFSNGMTESEGSLIWDTKRLFGEILKGMKKCKEMGKIPVSVGVDTWGVDFVLLDESDEIIGDAVGYRDSRTTGMDEAVYKVISEEELYERTGIQKAIYNTIFQLMSLKVSKPEHLKRARSLLMIPDYFHFLLSGVKTNEYTEASTSGLLNPSTHKWDMELIEALGFPKEIFGEIKMPGTVLGCLLPSVKEEVGYDCQVILPCSHDTASAVLAMPAADDNALYISSGTWSLMGVLLNKPNCSMESRMADITNEGGYGGQITYLTNIMGLWMIQSVRNELAPNLSYDELCKAAAKEEIRSLVDCQDSVFLAPKDMAEAIRNYCYRTGQDVPDTVFELAAVIYNSLADCYAKKLELIERVTEKKFEKIHIIGGGSNAGYLNELTAKATGLTVVAGPGEATATGSILAQMIEMGEFEDFTKAKECILGSFEVKEFRP
ncbi:MAG: rhamnulokinase [Lachnospiraceae bacterium]|nr:rhamnulokinase [Lachnospiraceae bacterium]